VGRYLCSCFKAICTGYASAFSRRHGGVTRRARKRYIRGLIHRYQEYLAGRTKFEEERTNELRGLLAFVLDVEPDFYNRLALKYGAQTVNAALHARRRSR